MPVRRLPTPAAPSVLRHLPAPAKVNLFLHLLGRRADGMHLLQSAFVLIDWCDTLHLTRRDDGVLQRIDLGARLPFDDLCLRAAGAPHRARCTPLGVDIAIDKRVPWGAGLGGGSSDAATVLIGLNRLWGLNWPRSQLIELGLSLGADVPFFLGQGSAFVEGIGERLMPMALRPLDLMVVKPPAPLATAEVFGHPAVMRGTAAVAPAAILKGFLAGGVKARQGSLKHADEPPGHNDLQAAAQALCPQVSQALDAMQRRFGHARMSGSGSAVFSLLRKKVGASGSRKATLSSPTMTGWPKGWTARQCRSLEHHPLADWLTG
jgi:4-diphosphocytidyl-2-C-methyl-D-erythritol kinase